jgi:hypothetical protein|tara:strand:+ start:2313 stop:2630 length:318 start_codon:yes stop_codon:yes gene_type:complete
MTDEEKKVANLKGIVQKNTVRIDGNEYDVDTLPTVAKIAIEHLVSIDKEVQRLEMARAGFAQAIKAVMDGDDAPKPVGGVKVKKAPQPEPTKIRVDGATDKTPKG